MSSEAFARREVVLAVSIAFTSASVLIVGLRVYTRAILVRSFGKDDCAILAALFFVLSYLATIILQRFNGMGFTGSDLTPQQMKAIIKTVIAIEVLYYLCVNAIKISILLFYLRLLLKNITRRLCQATIAFLVTFCTISVIVVVTQCIPLRMMWDFSRTVKGTCVNATAFFYITCGTNVVIDIWILLLPIEFLIRMERPNREKTALICIFALGALSCIASCVRLYTVRIYTESTDPFSDAIPINTWSMIEINLGIDCASLPALKALISKTRAKFKRAPRGTFHLRDTGMKLKTIFITAASLLVVASAIPYPPVGVSISLGHKGPVESAKYESKSNAGSVLNSIRERHGHDEADQALSKDDAPTLGGIAVDHETLIVKKGLDNIPHSASPRGTTHDLEPAPPSSPLVSDSNTNISPPSLHSLTMVERAADPRRGPDPRLACLMCMNQVNDCKKGCHSDPACDTYCLCKGIETEWNCMVCTDLNFTQHCEFKGSART